LKASIKRSERTKWKWIPPHSITTPKQTKKKTPTQLLFFPAVSRFSNSFHHDHSSNLIYIWKRSFLLTSPIHIGHLNLWKKFRLDLLPWTISALELYQLVQSTLNKKFLFFFVSMYKLSFKIKFCEVTCNMILDVRKILQKFSTITFHAVLYL